MAVAYQGGGKHGFCRRGLTQGRSAKSEPYR